jgi:hypothetical protein
MGRFSSKEVAAAVAVDTSEEEEEEEEDVAPAPLANDVKTYRNMPLLIPREAPALAAAAACRCALPCTGRSRCAAAARREEGAIF